MTYVKFFQHATRGITPYPYQQRLATEAWPDTLDIPTGLGKTAAVVLAWLYKRWHGDHDTPRRLIICLPMRVLVEQTETCIQKWLGALVAKDTINEQRFGVHLIMGGEDDLKTWVDTPEKESILIGTQDMLLSRALMRGYGMSRYRWPIDFALLHNDALWVFDEVQLMGASLSTSTQMEAFRRQPDLPLAKSSHTIWMSATLNRNWLSSIDFRPFISDCLSISLTFEEQQQTAVRKRREAVKTLQPAIAKLDTTTSKDKQRIYLETLSKEVIAVHDSSHNTLIILNNVERAQRLKQVLDTLADQPVLLVHARFRAKERERLNSTLLEVNGRIIVATQAIEAGVDISSRVLFTELAPWSSLVQRFGRCNRAGEHSEAKVFWIDIESGTKLSPPYDDETLDAAREVLISLNNQSVSAANLPPVTEDQPVQHVLRRKDFIELFNTDPDLTGFDVDISPYIRDSGTPPIQVFWRDFENEPDNQPRPERNELCPASLSQLRAHLKSKNTRGWVWDTLSRKWRSSDTLRPGMTLMLRCSDGGYTNELGFNPGYKVKKATISDLHLGRQPAEDYRDDRRSQIGRFIRLPDHLAHVPEQSRKLCEAIEETSFLEPVVRACRWHDVGKAHPEFLKTMLHGLSEADPKRQHLWAKSAGNARHERAYFRHELASMICWLEHGEKNEHHDLIAFLIAAHHGKVRMSLRALPVEKGPQDNRRFARGVWEGDQLPAFSFDGESIPETRLRLDVMELGEGEMGASWTSRTQLLIKKHGPFLLAWLETLVRIADWRASAIEQEITDEV